MVPFHPASLDPEEAKTIEEEKGKRNAGRAAESSRFHGEIDRAADGPQPALSAKDHDGLAALGDASLGLGRVADGLEYNAAAIGLLTRKAPDAATREAGKPALIEALNQWEQATSLREELDEKLIGAIPPGVNVTPPDYRVEPIPPGIPEHHQLPASYPSKNDDGHGRDHELGSSYAYRQAEAILGTLDQLKGAPIEMDTAALIDPAHNTTRTEQLLEGLNRQYDGAADPNSNEALLRAARDRESALEQEILAHNARVADFDRHPHVAQRPDPPARVDHAADLAYWNGIIQAYNDRLHQLRAEADRLNAEAAAQNSEADAIARRIASLSDR